MSNQKFEAQKNVLMQEIRDVLKEVEGLYEDAVDDGSGKLEKARENAKEKLTAIKSQLIDAEADLMKKAQKTAKKTDKMVRDQPYYAMGVAALAGVVIGALLGRR